MRSRTLVLGLLAAALAVPTTLSNPAQAAEDWRSIRARWSGPQQAVKVVDVKAFDNWAGAVGNTRKSGQSRPWVQECSPRRCVPKSLPRPGGNSTVVSSISGASRQDMWAVGAYRSGGLLRPVMWRKTGSTWKIFRSGLTVQSGAEQLQLTQIEVANKSKAFALGRYNYVNGSTSTLYRWNGTAWKELAPRGDTSTFADPCEGWFNRKWSDLMVRSGSAMLVGRCGTRSKPAVLEQGTGSWHLASGSGFPDNAVWTKGSFIGEQAWLYGTRTGAKVFFKRDGGKWSKVTTKGIRGRASVADFAGPFSNRIAAVGFVRTGRGHREAASWRWGKNGWHATSVPAGVSRSYLSAVSVDGTNKFFAVGTDVARQPSKRGLILRAD